VGSGAARSPALEAGASTEPRTAFALGLVASLVRRVAIQTCARPRVSAKALEGARSRRGQRCVRPTSALRNRFSRAPVLSSLSQRAFRRTPHARAARPSAPVRCSSMRTSRSRAFPSRSGETRIERLGATDAKRGWGGSRFTTRASLRRPDEHPRGSFSSPRVCRSARLWRSCRLLRFVDRGKPACAGFFRESRSKAAKIGSAGAS